MLILFDYKKIMIESGDKIMSIKKHATNLNEDVVTVFIDRKALKPNIQCIMEVSKLTNLSNTSLNAGRCLFIIGLA